VIGGSLPPGFSTSHLKKIVHTLKKRGIHCVVDTPGKILKEIVHSKPLLIKPNLTEFQELTGTKATSIQDVIKVAKKLNSKVPLICVSSVENGALLITQDKVWFGKIPPVRVKTTVGAGDSMVGAISAQIWKQMKNITPLTSKTVYSENGGELLRWGLAAATATLITAGTQLGDYKQMIHYYPKIMIRKIS
jgi:fructose-1-phosphate kinase PfkB-like protein